MDDHSQSDTADSSSESGVTNSFGAAPDPEFDKLTRSCTPATAALTDPEALPALPGFELGAMLGEGGMGIVIRAHDLTIRRDVAIKFLKLRFVGRETAVQRFVEEARITGQLQHPGIPPVHQMGAIAGRPYIVMKLIKGRTLQQIIDDGGPREPGLFESICQTLAYAHARNLLHRDLKPSNIMVGAFAQIQVMDWGLAKVVPEEFGDLPDADEAAEKGTTEIQATVESKRSNTLNGSVVGTPAYMPPEQASGELHRIDRRSDVFGLGAVLCAVLTGKPPYVGRRDQSVRLMAIAGKLDGAFRRLDECGAEPELIALCKRCLSFVPSSRPEHAGIVADEVGRIRLRTTQRIAELEIEKQTDAVRQAEQRKRRGLRNRAAGAIAAVLVLGLIGTTVGLVAAREKAAQSTAAEAKERDARRDAESAGDEARRRYKSSLDVYTQMSFAVQDKLESLPGTSAARKYLLARAQAGLRDLLADRFADERPDHALIWAHIKLGDLLMFSTENEAAETEYRAAYDQATLLHAAEPDSRQSRRNLIECTIRLGDAARKRIGRHADAEAYYTRAEAMAKEDAAADADDPSALRRLANAQGRLAALLLERHKAHLAVPMFRAVYAVRTRLAGGKGADPSDQRAVGESRLALADGLVQTESRDEAGRHYEECRRFFKARMDADPDDARTIRDYSVACHRTGDFLVQSHKYREAAACYGDAMRGNQKLVNGDPFHDGFRRNLAVSLEKLGDMSLHRRDYEAAKKHFQKSLEYRLASVALDGGDASAQRDLAVSYGRLASYWDRVGNSDEARVQYGRSLQLFEKLAAADQERTGATVDLVTAMKCLADVQTRCLDFDEAVRLYARATVLLRALTARPPSDPETGVSLPAHIPKLLKESEAAGASANAVRAALDDLTAIDRQPEAAQAALFLDRMRVMRLRRNRQAVVETLAACERLSAKRPDLTYTMAVLSAAAAETDPDPARRASLIEATLTWLAKEAEEIGDDDAVELCEQMELEPCFRFLTDRSDFRDLLDEIRARVPGMADPS